MSLIGAQCVGDAGRVIAFEPAPPLVEILRYHKRVNRLKQMEVVMSAVSDMDRQLVPFFVMNNGFGVGNSLVAHELEGPTRESAVRTLTLDSYCSQTDCWPDVVKIDVEGGEMLVLKGARSVLSRKRPRLIVAVHPPWLPGGQTTAALFDLVASYGYRLQDSKVYPYKGEEFADDLFSCEAPVGTRSGTTL